MTPFIEQYLEICRNTEPPKIFQLWASISITAAALGRNVWFKHGMVSIVPNIYVMLIGEPGSRKSTAIKTAKKFLAHSGYETLAPDKSTKEKFLLDFEKGFTFDSDAIENEEELNTFLESELESESREVYIPADEWLEFFGEANVGFATLLGTLWDYDGVYRDRLKNSKSVSVPNPTVNILGGCTHDTFKLSFPPNLLGHGFISRLILVFGERRAERITWPREISDIEKNLIAKQLQEMRHKLFGQMTVTSQGMEVLDEIYKSWEDLEDIRFQHYSTRRFTQLLKLCLIIAAQHMTTEVTREHIIAANTILTYTEQAMPKALGEFGASKNSAVTQKIIAILDASDSPVTIKQLWKLLSRDLDKLTDLAQILQNLTQADKIQRQKGGFLPNRIVRYPTPHLINFTELEKYLT